MIEAAALFLCKLGGKSGSADEIKAVIEAAGLEVDEEQLTKLTGDIEGKDIEELLKEGAEIIKKVPFGGGGGGGAGSGAAAGAADQGEAAKEEVPEEEEAPPAVDMFGGGEKGGDY